MVYRGNLVAQASIRRRTLQVRSPVTPAVPAEVTAAPSDAELVAAARAAPGPGASNAFGQLVLRYERMVSALVQSLVSEPSDSSDVVQEAFLRAFRNLDLLADPSRFGVWLRRIAFGVSIDHVHAERVRRRRTRALGPSFDSATVASSGEGAASVALDAVPDAGPSALERLEQTAVAARVLAELDRLPARYRVPFTLFHIDGLSHAKVAAVLGAPEGTVRSLVARARQKLARLLADSPEVRDMARESGVTSALDVFEATVSHTPRLLHVLNGDVVREILERSDVPGAFAPYADILHEGPVPVATDTPNGREARARYIAARGYGSYAEALRTYESWNESVARFADYDEVILWFEHDLFDQLLLVRHLDWFSRRELGRTRLSLICVGEFAGLAPFHGLGQLDANQLASLLGTRAPVSAEQLALGRRGWEALTAPDPRELVRLAAESAALARTLQFLPGALRRFLEEYPSTDNGLPRTERHILECLTAGTMSIEALFRAGQAREERVFMGDWTFWNRVRELAGGPTPLVHLDVEDRAVRDLPAGTADLTEAGRAVLAGRADWVTLGGFDRWLGGVHLEAPLGGDVAWRYDAASGGLLTPRPSPGPR